MAWQKLSSQQVYQNRYMTVTEDELKTDHGDKITYGIVHKEPAVWIIPYDGGKVLLIGQYRYPVDYFSWEFPAGHAEKNSPAIAAAHELEEETGLIAKDLTELGTFHIAPGHLTQIAHVYLATQFEQGVRELEPSEKGMQQKWVTLKELNSLIADGTIKDGPTITSLKIFELYLSTPIL